MLSNSRTTRRRTAFLAFSNLISVEATPTDCTADDAAFDTAAAGAGVGVGSVIVVVVAVEDTSWVLGDIICDINLITGAAAAVDVAEDGATTVGAGGDVMGICAAATCSEDFWRIGGGKVSLEGGSDTGDEETVSFAVIAIMAVLLPLLLLAVILAASTAATASNASRGDIVADTAIRRCRGDTSGGQDIALSNTDSTLSPSSPSDDTS